MKKKIILLTFLLSFNFCFSQNKSSTDSLMIVALTQKLSSTDSLMQKLIKDFDSIQSLSNANSTSVSALLAGQELQSKAKYEIIKNNLINSTEMFELLSDKIIDLKSRNATQDFEKLIKDLNNPESKALGFSFNEKIIELVKTHINPTKKNLALRIVETVEGITKSPIISSIPQLTPALSVASSAMNVIRSTGVVKNEVDHTKIEAFEKELSKYIEYYVALNDANQNLVFSVSKQRSELGLLHQKLYDQLLFFSKNLNYAYQPKNKEETINSYMNNYFKKFNKDWIEKYFSDLEKNNTKDGKIEYDVILASNSSLKEANNRLEELISLVNQFEFEYNDFFDFMQIYHSSIEKALDISVSKGIAEKAIVIEKKQEFLDKKTNSTSMIKDAIDIQELTDNRKNIKYSARIL